MSITSGTTHGGASNPNWDGPDAPQGESHNMCCIKRIPLEVHWEVLDAKEAMLCRQPELLNWSAKSTCAKTPERPPESLDEFTNGLLTQPEEGVVPDMPIDVGYAVDCSENSDFDHLEDHRSLQASSGGKEY